jgi:hypothetical protein
MEAQAWFTEVQDFQWSDVGLVDDWSEWTKLQDPSTQDWWLANPEMPKIPEIPEWVAMSPTRSVGLAVNFSIDDYLMV